MAEQKFNPQLTNAAGVPLWVLGDDDQDETAELFAAPTHEDAVRMVLASIKRGAEGDFYTDRELLTLLDDGTIRVDVRAAFETTRFTDLYEGPLPEWLVPPPPVKLETKYVVTAKIAGLLGFLQHDMQFRLDRSTARRFTKLEAENMIALLSLGSDVKLDMDPDLPDY
jgi:hypothetical protein